ncbi:hypothetical protein KCU77_g101, partial [Aureobasidium melanogenum]
LPTSTASLLIPDSTAVLTAVRELRDKLSQKDTCYQNIDNLLLSKIILRMGILRAVTLKSTIGASSKIGTALQSHLRRSPKTKMTLVCLRGVFALESRWISKRQRICFAVASILDEYFMGECLRFDSVYRWGMSSTTLMAVVIYMTGEYRRDRSPSLKVLPCDTLTCCNCSKMAAPEHSDSNSTNSR